MSKWKCDICGKEFDNFHAQGFDNNVYCPSCFVREENKRLREKIKDLEEKIILLRASEPMLELEKYYGERDKYKEVIEKVNNELITLIQIIMEQPSKNVEEDNYLLSRLESISNILTEVNNE